MGHWSDVAKAMASSRVLDSPTSLETAFRIASRRRLRCLFADLQLIFPGSSVSEIEGDGTTALANQADRRGSTTWSVVEGTGGSSLSAGKEGLSTITPGRSMWGEASLLSMKSTWNEVMTRCEGRW